MSSRLGKAVTYPGCQAFDRLIDSPALTLGLRSHPSARHVLVQREMERERSPFDEYFRPARGDFQGIGSTDPMRCFLKSAEAKPPRSVHRLDEPTGLSLSMVASPQCRFRFARRNHCSASATSAANFRIGRNSGVIWCAAKLSGSHHARVTAMSCAGTIAAAPIVPPFRSSYAEGFPSSSATACCNRPIQSRKRICARSIPVPRHDGRGQRTSPRTSLH